MSKFTAFLTGMRDLHTRKAKAMSRKRKCLGDDIVLSLPSGITLRTPPGSIVRATPAQPSHAGGLQSQSPA